LAIRPLDTGQVWNIQVLVTPAIPELTKEPLFE
jgi:hypothetical protein